MPSSIQPYQIDNTFPVAGQDNDSQGFRDNFTNTKNNFQNAKDDIDQILLDISGIQDSIDPYYLSTVEQVSSGNISVATSTTYFVNLVAAQGVLPNATKAGQIKTLIMAANNGAMVVNLSNPGWLAQGSGTITFSSIGKGCTLQYINNKWFCIGNNGCTFA